MVVIGVFNNSPTIALKSYLSVRAALSKLLKHFESKHEESLAWYKQGQICNGCPIIRDKQISVLNIQISFEGGGVSAVYIRGDSDVYIKFKLHCKQNIPRIDEMIN